MTSSAVEQKPRQTYLCGHDYPTEPVRTTFMPIPRHYADPKSGRTEVHRSHDPNDNILPAPPHPATLPCMTCLNIVRHSSGPVAAELILGPEVFSRIPQEVLDEWLGNLTKKVDAEKPPQNPWYVDSMARQKTRRRTDRLAKLELTRQRLVVGGSWLSARRWREKYGEEVMEVVTARTQDMELKVRSTKEEWRRREEEKGRASPEMLLLLGEGPGGIPEVGLGVGEVGRRNETTPDSRAVAEELVGRSESLAEKLFIFSKVADTEPRQVWAVILSRKAVGAFSDLEVEFGDTNESEIVVPRRRIQR